MADSTTVSSMTTALESISSSEARGAFKELAATLSESQQSQLVRALSLILANPESAPQAASATGLASVSTLSIASIVCSLPDVSCMAPRGTFTIEFASGSFQFRGKTSSDVVLKDDIVFVHTLERGEDVSLLVIRLRSGQLFLIAIKGKNIGKARAILGAEGTSLREPLPTVMQHDTTPRIAILEGLIAQCLGCQISRSDAYPISQKRFIACNIKSVNEGRLFLLWDSGSMVFVGSPITHIAREQIASFSLEKASSRSYELHFVLEPSPASTADVPGGKKPKPKDTVIEFSQIMLVDVPVVEEFLAKLKALSASSKSQEVMELKESSEEDSSDGLFEDESTSSSSSSGSSGTDREEGAEEDGRRSVIVTEDIIVIEEEDGEEDDDDDSSSESSDDTEDPNAAEIVDEEPFVPDPEDVIFNVGEKRRRVNRPGET